jgi:hypothetical protein
LRDRRTVGKEVFVTVGGVALYERNEFEMTVVEDLGRVAWLLFGIWDVVGRRTEG